MQTLFDKVDINVHFAEIKKLAVTKVSEIPKEQFLQSTDAELLVYVLDRSRLEPITLMEDARETVSYEEGRKSRPDGYGGTEEISILCVHFRYPFDGGDYLWYARPSPFSTPPEGEVEREIKSGISRPFINAKFEFATDADPSLHDATVKNWLSNVQWYLQSQRNMIESFNARALPDLIKREISRRKDVLGRHAAIIKQLNIQLNHIPGVPEPVRIPMQRRVIKPPAPLPNVPAQAAIRDEDYEHILSVLRHAGRTFEAAPRTFSKFEEEELRYVMLAHLNTHYQGDASGEAFRQLGKSDIKIEFDNRAAFVAECKVWGGDKEVEGAVAQLHRYLTWRDCKTAIIIFNKNVAGFTAIQGRMAWLLAACNGFSSKIPTEAGEWRCLFRSPEDDGCVVTTQVFLFNLYSVAGNSAK